MFIISFFANLFGYILNALYEFVSNYGLAMILFSIILKIILLPISLKQQKAIKLNEKMQQEMKQIQFKYKNNPEKMNQEMIGLYKRENYNPFSGCLSAIVQLIILLSVFYLVSSPLTYMRKVDSEVIQTAKDVIKQEQETTNAYQEIAVLQFIKNLENQASVNEEDVSSSENVQNEIIEEQEKNNELDQEIVQNENREPSSENEQIIEQEQNENNSSEADKVEQNEEIKEKEAYIKEHIDELKLNMNFLGVDLSKVPTQDLKDPKVLIIPILYIISTFISIKLTTAMQKQKKKEKLLGDGEKEKQPDELEAIEQTNKMMTWMMPIMSISIALIAPLGLALYWLSNNILMIIERIVLNKIDKKEEAEKNA